MTDPLTYRGVECEGCDASFDTVGEFIDHLDDCVGVETAYEVVIEAVEDREHADLLRRKLVREGFHDHAVSVREVAVRGDGDG